MTELYLIVDKQGAFKGKPSHIIVKVCYTKAQANEWIAGRDQFYIQIGFAA